MYFIFRRVPLLILSFAFFLLLSPELFSTPAHAQQAVWPDIGSILPAATQGGIGVIMLIVIIFQSRKDKQKNDEVMTLFTAQLTSQNETTKLAFEKYNESTQLLIGLLKANQDQSRLIQIDNQETISLLTGTLSRMEVKLGIPIKCPFGEFSQLTQKEKRG
ncbi:MAG: hypothetical protein M0R70_12675 [Nitrospirae bacterium]|nr:hypothetical protein [Nitrospirota bacterium]